MVYRTFYRLSVVVVDDVASVIILSLLSNSFYEISKVLNCLAIVNSVSVTRRNNK